MASPVRPGTAGAVASARVPVWGRAGVLGAVAMATGTVSHVLGQGHLPGPVALAALLAVCVAVAAFFLRVRATAVRLVLLVVAGQTFVHGALSSLAGHRGDASPAPTPLPDMPTGDARPSRFFDHYESVAASTLAGPTRSDWLAHQVEHLTAQGPAMVLAHLGGAVALGLFLAVGESALWSLLALAVARALVRTRALTQTAVARGVRRGVALRAGLLGSPLLPVLRPALLDRRTEKHRGPPFVLVA
ncbi:hypothetical protein IEQ44_02055 [Nocardioides sp. Y6]|uniref:Integral membrane protein n=1 Tax=Nocardioides malaquae TaxID=2773426 RepID=A0ABR9RPU7_9ACTN|nr:hypothetical protein [Nocardioides malaquae]MBE7323435.1 hypothetical protein [Nocardioides malaquae]